MTTEQKFKRGDVVHIAADLGPSMSHFTADKNAIVMGSYRDKYGGDHNVNDYTVMLLDTGVECSWYHAHQLTLIRHGGEEEIARVKAARADREKYETDLAWIVENWANIRERMPGATIGELMRRLGIVNPWGARGEGITYYSNAMATFHLLDPILSTGDLAQVESFFANETNTASGSK